MNTQPSRRRIIAIGMIDSIHFARWLQNFREESVEIMIFPSSPNRRVLGAIQDLLGYKGPAQYSYAFKNAQHLGLVLWVLDKFLDNRIRGTILSTLIWRHKPDFVHALELQNAGYVALQAWKRKIPVETQLILTNYGSDIYWFARKSRHRRKLKELLSHAHRYACECERDVSLALTYGFSGMVLPVQPNAGGFSTEELDLDVSSRAIRTSIAIKGYHGWVGRARLVIEALRTIQDDVNPFLLEVYSCNRVTTRAARRLAKETGLKVKTYSKGQLTHDEMRSLFARSAIYIGISESDGISTSLLEAMAYGAIPVQTYTACCDEWFSSTGVKVNEISVSEIATAIKRAIALSADSRNASINQKVIRERASRNEIRTNAILFYRGNDEA